MRRRALLAAHECIKCMHSQGALGHATVWVVKQLCGFRNGALAAGARMHQAAARMRSMRAERACVRQVGVSLVLSFMVVWDLPTIAAGVRSLQTSRLGPIYNEVAPSVAVFSQLFGKALQAQVLPTPPGPLAQGSRRAGSSPAPCTHARLP